MARDFTSIVLAHCNYAATMPDEVGADSFDKAEMTSSSLHH